MSNHLLDTTWPKVAATKGAFSVLLKGEASGLTDGLLGLLSDRNQAADDQLPRTGVGREWERLLSAAFIASSRCGTRSSTAVLVGRGGGIVFVERTFGPGGTPGEQRRFTLPKE